MWGHHTQRQCPKIPLQKDILVDPGKKLHFDVKEKV